MLVRDTTPPGSRSSCCGAPPSAAFAAGMYVFPGGRVDEVDGAAAIEAFCTGLDDAAASAALGLDHGGLAYWVAAVRECFEEAGVLLARRRDGGPPRVDDAERRAVHAGELSMVELCRRHDLVLDLSEIRYVAHWVTPVGEPRRFDTRFFLAAAPPGQDGQHDDAELVDSRWVRPADALAAVEAGDLLMLPPTLANLRALAASGRRRRGAGGGRGRRDRPSASSPACGATRPGGWSGSPCRATPTTTPITDPRFRLRVRETLRHR